MNPYFVSFHPQIPMEKNLPLFQPLETPELQRLVGEAAGVVVPTYITPSRYASIVRCARNCFPRLEARFDYCGKTRQIHLFRRLGVRHPESVTFENPSRLRETFLRSGTSLEYPMVLKGDTGGGGSRVFPVHSRSDLLCRLGSLPGDEPVLVQEWVHHGGRDLRVVVYGDRAVSYFRVGDGQFYNNVCRGGYIDRDGSPREQEKGVRAVRDFCRRTGIDIAGFDLMFPDDGEPVFIEINFHFGRKGLGGTRGHREYFRQAVEAWRTDCLLRLPA